MTAAVDHFAQCGNHRYGTLLCDLERRRIVAPVLPAVNKPPRKPG